jgi:general secretion pathway protein B
MSFILDALKKAESERSRSAGPVLMDVRVVAQRQRLPTWAWVLGGALLANLLLLGWLLLGRILLRKDEPAPAVAAATSQAPIAQPAPPLAPPAAVTQPTIDETVLPAPAVAPVPATVPLPEAELLPAPPVERTQRAASSPALPLLPRIDNLPTAQDLVAQGVALPALQLLLLAYDDLPANRYVLLNARRLREGDEVADGIRLESIVPTGVVLNARGRRFVLLAGS